MEYITYSRYVELGGVLLEPAFNSTMIKVKNIIKQETFNKVDKLETTVDELEMCCVELIEYMTNLKEQTLQNIQSVSGKIGTASETITYNNASHDVIDKNILMIINDYLSNIYVGDNNTSLTARTYVV